MLSALALSGAQFISKRIVTAAGTYNLTPPAGATCFLFKARGASGAVYEPGASSTVIGGPGAFVSGLCAVSPGDTVVATVGAGGVRGGGTLPGGGASSLTVNGTAKMIVAGGGAAVYSGYGSGAIAAAGAGGIASGVSGSTYNITGYGGTDPDGPGASGATPGYNIGSNAGGGQGYAAGGNGSYAGGGGSSYIDSSLTHVVSAAGSGTLPGNHTDPDLGASVGASVAANYAANGVDGGFMIAWYTADPFAGGLITT